MNDAMPIAAPGSPVEKPGRGVPRTPAVAQAA